MRFEAFGRFVAGPLKGTEEKDCVILEKEHLFLRRVNQDWKGGFVSL